MGRAQNVYKNSSVTAENNLFYVKRFLLKSDIYALALRKRRFYNAKQTLLPHKTYAFEPQNNNFLNALIESKLGDSCSYEK
ncbi:hypothetical protein CUC00_09895 [Prevotella intermedia]|nr:hypothetical protein CTM44_00045 [Prevotella intermedia]ATV41317.1 hypothetical protein CUC00_09895 [Prevotella intermedia]